MAQKLFDSPAMRETIRRLIRSRMAYRGFEYKDLAELQREKVAELAAEVEAWLDECGARLPRPNPDFDPARPAYKGRRTTKDLAERQRLQLQTRGCDRPGDRTGDRR